MKLQVVAAITTDGCFLKTVAIFSMTILTIASKLWFCSTFCDILVTCSSFHQLFAWEWNRMLTAMPPPNQILELETCQSFLLDVSNGYGVRQYIRSKAVRA